MGWKQFQNNAFVMKVFVSFEHHLGAIYHKGDYAYQYIFIKASGKMA